MRILGIKADSLSEVSFKHPGHGNQKVHTPLSVGGRISAARSAFVNRAKKIGNSPEAQAALGGALHAGGSVAIGEGVRSLFRGGGKTTVAAGLFAGGQVTARTGANMIQRAEARSRGAAQLTRVRRIAKVSSAAVHGANLARKYGKTAFRVGRAAYRGYKRAQQSKYWASHQYSRPSDINVHWRDPSAPSKIAGLLMGKELRAGLTVFKDKDDNYRWVLLSSNGFRDRDGEIVATKALEHDVALWDLQNQPPQPLRWWHVSLDDGHELGLDLGYTDFRMVHGHTLIESGNFLAKEIGESVYNAQDKLAGSIGFRHSSKEPDVDKTFNTVRIFERSLLPKESASNVLTHLVVTD